MPFQTTVNTYPAPGISGDFYGANPRRSMLATQAELTVGASTAGGLYVGRFAYARNDNGKTYNNRPGVSCRVGFVNRDQPGIITAWLGTANTVIPTGISCTLHDGGDFWCGFLAATTFGQKVFSVDQDATTIAGVVYSAGMAVSGPAGTPIMGATETNYYVHKAAGAGEVSVISTALIVS